MMAPGSMTAPSVISFFLADDADAPLAVFHIAADFCACADHAALGNDRIADRNAVFNHHVRHNHAVDNLRALSDRAAGGNDRVVDHAVNFAAVGDKALVQLCGFCDVACRLRRVSGVDLVPLGSVDVERRMLAQQVHVRFPETRNRTDVLPVAVKLIGKEPVPGIEKRRNDVLAEVVFARGVRLIRFQEFLEHAPLEDVNAHRRIGSTSGTFGFSSNS